MSSIKDDLEAVLALEATLKRIRNHCMYQEKMLVAKTWGLDFANVDQPWEAWLDIWTRFVDEIGVVRTADGPRLATEADVTEWD